MYPRGGSQLQPPLGALVLNSWLVSSLSLFSTNLTNYLIWIVSERVTHVYPRGGSQLATPSRLWFLILGLSPLSLSSLLT